jgi:hypothetical protein
MNVEQRVRALTGCTFQTVPDCAPVFAIDIDVLEDLEFICRDSQRRRAAGEAATIIWE